MTERVALAIIAGVVVIVATGTLIGWNGAAVAERLQLLREVAIGLLGALGGYAIGRESGR